MRKELTYPTLVPMGGGNRIVEMPRPEEPAPPRLDPNKYYGEVNGRMYRLSTLSHEDLLQVACQSLQDLKDSVARF